MKVQNETESAPTVIRLPEVLRMCGVSRPSVYRKMKEGTFPKQLKLGTAAVGWLRAEVEQWINEKAQARSVLLPEQGLESRCLAA